MFLTKAIYGKLSVQMLSTFSSPVWENNGLKLRTTDGLVLKYLITYIYVTLFFFYLVIWSESYNLRTDRRTEETDLL